MRTSISVTVMVPAVILLIAAALLPTEVGAQSVTAFKSGEEVTGTTKQCYYTFAGSRYTRTMQSYQLCPLSIQVATARSPAPSPPPSRPAIPSTVTAFKTGERTTGMTKQCFYSFGSSEYTRTIQSYELCPLSIAVRP